MPILPIPDYRPPLLFRSGHLASIFPPLFRVSPMTAPMPERIELPDGDFLDFDLHRSHTGDNRRLVIVSHGLEGNSRRKYVLGMARMATENGWDAVCWSQRGCSGEPNRLERSYHSGETGDIHAVIRHCLSTGEYDKVALIGFSMGGNQILKYLGENPAKVPEEVCGAVTFSVPCDLVGCEEVLAQPSRRIYFEYFMKGLRKKVQAKAALFPDKVDAKQLDDVHRLSDFDDRFTARWAGFKNAAEYYKASGAINVLDGIQVPTLLVNAANDPFMSPSCYPETAAQKNTHLWLEIPRFGGHVGFVLSGKENVYWSELRAETFLKQLIG